ncbi:unnamed protein product [Fusarium langsethiae]|nr:unnamed protein product [Fusarium langsethiae]
MAGVIQLGDAIKFAELAWTVWELGWASENNAGKNYRDFGADVGTLHRSLKELENAVCRAHESLRSHGASDTDSLCGDKDSLFEVIGDYNATLSECHQLLMNNRRYAETTGPIKNIDWNINIMPQVEHLRSRIQMHTCRIQHILKPFQIDLVTNIHRDLDRRFRAVHMDVQVIRRTLTSLLQHENPSLARQIEQEIEAELVPVEISDLLLHRMKGLDELQNPRRTSHWPGYIISLEEELSEEYSQVQSTISVPDTSMYNDEMLAFWPEDEPQTATSPIAPDVGYTCLFQGPLANLSPGICRREIKLLRQLDSNSRFRIIETSQSNDLPLKQELRMLDFDLQSAVLIPLYADPMGRSTAIRPLEIIIEANRSQHHYVFLYLQDVLAFQAFMTGFKVVDGYMDFAGWEVNAAPIASLHIVPRPQIPLVRAAAA